jgi:IS30 family transposase
MYKQINQTQRYELSAFLKAGLSKTSIASQLGIDRSSIYREINRNSDNQKYTASDAQQYTTDRKNHKRAPRKFTLGMKKLILEKLKLYWSPEQIDGRCEIDGISMVSHETIYQYIWSDKASGGDLYTYLRNSNKKYKKRYGKKDSRGQIPNKKNISERPAIVEDKQRIGDWEIDLIIGKNHKGAILTATERKTCYELMVLLPNKSSKTIKRALINLLAPYKDRVLTITSDNGREFYEHEAVAKKLSTLYYFANPYCSWERGLNEYQNKLIRQFIPKKSSFELVTHKQIITYQNLLNSRPRKNLDYKTPNELFLYPSVALAS